MSGDSIKRATELQLLDAQALDLRAKGKSYRAIAEAMGVHPQTAWERVQRALKAQREEPAAEVRALELERLDQLWEKALAVAERNHVTVSGSAIVVDNDGEPLRDSGPELAAIKTLLSIMERRARLLGLDSPVKADVGIHTTYEIKGNPEALT